MLISMVCNICNITKKAIEYYERQGFIQPEIMENGYRNYTDKEIAMLKEVSMLRKLDINVADIKAIVFSKDKCKALAEYQAKREILLEHAKAQYNCIGLLIMNGYNLEEVKNFIEHTLDNNAIIRDKLLHSFPGNYGKFISLHFGRFLTEKIDTAEKAVAYQNVLDFLDSIERIHISKELEECFETISQALSGIDFERMEDAMTSAMDDYEGYAENNREFIEQYIELRNSEEYKSSATFKMQKLLLDFQQSSGYYDLFIPNLKILSKSYERHLSKLQKANDVLMAQFPQLKTMYIEA